MIDCCSSNWLSSSVVESAGRRPTGPWPRAGGYSTSKPIFIIYNPVGPTWLQANIYVPAFTNICVPFQSEHFIICCQNYLTVGAEVVTYEFPADSEISNAIRWCDLNGGQSSPVTNERARRTILSMNLSTNNVPNEAPLELGEEECKGCVSCRLFFISISS